jgi:hypothetical protein
LGVQDDDSSIGMVVAAGPAQVAAVRGFGGAVPIVLIGGIFLAELFPVN